MPWTIEYTETALAQLRKLDKPAAHRIVDYMNGHVAGLADPRSAGRALSGPLGGPLGGLWRYRIGNYRAVCDIQADTLRVLVLRVGSRDRVYR